MTPTELRALVDALATTGRPGGICQQAADYLLACADETPVAKITKAGNGSIALLAHEGGPFDMSKYIGAALFTHPAPATPQPCWCHKCNEGRLVNGIPFAMTQMIVCPICGNKRCPHASDHALACTASNDPIAVPAAPQAEQIDPHMIAAEDRFPDDDGPVILGEPDVLTPDDVRRVTRRAEPERPYIEVTTEFDAIYNVWRVTLTVDGRRFSMNYFTENPPGEKHYAGTLWTASGITGDKA